MSCNNIWSSLNLPPFRKIIPAITNFLCSYLWMEGVCCPYSPLCSDLNILRGYRLIFPPLNCCRHSFCGAAASTGSHWESQTKHSSFSLSVCLLLVKMSLQSHTLDTSENQKLAQTEAHLKKQHKYTSISILNTGSPCCCIFMCRWFTQRWFVDTFSLSLHSFF